MGQHRPSRALRAAVAALACAVVVPATSAAAAPGAAARAAATAPDGAPWTGYARVGGRPGGAFGATVRRTTHGVAHIEARDEASLGYGVGYAFAQDNLCTIADAYVTVAGERSRYFGAEGTWVFSGNGQRFRNLDSDAYYRWINARGFVERLAEQAPPNGPLPEVRALVRGYVAGYNDLLADLGGADGVPDPRCRGAAWVRPITETDVHRRFYQLASLASGGVAITGIANAEPTLDPAPARDAVRQRDLALELRRRLQATGIGSNAIGLGAEATDDGLGMLLGNPHFPWHGAERLWQVHLRIPGKMDVSGAALYGVPLVLIGHTRGLAWSHTVATSFRFTPFEVKLNPADPRQYLVDGRPKDMTVTRVRIPVKDGPEVARTIHETEHGPVLTSIFGLPLFPWTPATAYALGDVNATNFRYLNHFYETDRAQSVREYHAIQERYQGIPWVNSLAADRAGETYYSMNGATPNVSDAHAGRCNVPLGTATFAAIGLPVLDGSRSACAWETSDRAVAPGLMGNDRLPSLFRRDFVENGNDSHWMTNPAQLLEGFDRIVGVERTERTPRTRLGVRIIQDRLAGRDGRPGSRFTVADLQHALTGNRQYLGELWRDELVALCRANPQIDGVDVSGACDVLAAWNLTDELDAPGAVLFRRFATRAFPATVSLPAGTQGTTELGLRAFRVPFDPADPVNTPRGLADTPLVRSALADAVRDLQAAGLPLGATLRATQAETAGGATVPIPGGPGGLGVFNAITAPWDPARGFPDVEHGSSFVMAADFERRGCPARSQTFVTYGQSENPTSPHRADQLRAFSQERWTRPPFCREDVLRAAEQRVAVLGNACPARAGVGAVTVTAAGRDAVVRVRPRGAGAGSVRVSVVRVAPGGSGRILAVLARAVVPAGGGTVRVRAPRGLRDGVLVAVLRRGRGTARHERRVALLVRGGTVRRGPRFAAAPACGAVRAAALDAPVLDRDAGTTLRWRIDRAARVRVEVLRGTRVVRRYAVRTTPGDRTERLRVRGRGLPAGSLRVRMRTTLRSGRTLTTVLGVRR